MPFYQNANLVDQNQSVPFNFTEKQDVNNSSPRLHSFSKKINKPAKMSEKDQYHLLRPAAVATKTLGQESKHQNSSKLRTYRKKYQGRSGDDDNVNRGEAGQV